MPKQTSSSDDGSGDGRGDGAPGEIGASDGRLLQQIVQNLTSFQAAERDKARVPEVPCLYSPSAGPGGCAAPS